jgi:tetratricopeptide (TPR) repeat protein
MLKDKGTLIAISVTALLVAAGTFNYWKGAISPNDGDLVQQAQKANDANKPKEAIELAEKAIKANPKNVDAHIVLEEAFYNNNEPQRAIDEGNVALKSHLISDSAQLQKTMYLQGVAYMQLGQYKQAEDCLSDAADTQPPNADVYAAYGQALVFQKAYKEAVENFSEAIKLNAKVDDYYNRRGKALLQLGKFQDAKVDFAAADAINPKNEEYVLNFATALEKDGRYAQALYALEDTLDEKSSPALLKAEKRLAIETFDAAVYEHRSNRSSGGPYADGALGALHNHAYKDAILAANKALELGHETSPLAFRVKADAEYQLGQYQEALLDYSRALKLSPNDALTKRHQDRVLEKLRTK